MKKNHKPIFNKNHKTIFNKNHKTIFYKIHKTICNNNNNKENRNSMFLLHRCIKQSIEFLNLQFKYQSYVNESAYLIVGLGMLFTISVSLFANKIDSAYLISTFLTFGWLSLINNDSSKLFGKT